MDITGQHALVTGTSRGIGPAIAAALAERGARVICHARQREDAERAARVVAGDAVWGDLAVAEDLVAIAEQTTAIAPALPILVHNAGVLARGATEDVDRESLNLCFTVNVVAPVLLTQALLPNLRAAGGARVVVVSSTMGQLSAGMSGGSNPYRISKAAVNAWVVNAASELAADGILVNTMHPGWVRTDMGGAGASVEPAQAAATAAFLATLPAGGPSGRFWLDQQEIPW